jgi:type I restriction enzyme M protein
MPASVCQKAGPENGYLRNQELKSASRIQPDEPELVLTTPDAKDVFRAIRNFLAGRVVGATRDHALMREVLRCLFVRTYLVTRGGLVGIVSTDSITVADFYREYFGKLKNDLPSVFERDEELILDPEALRYIDTQLASVDLVSPSRDPIGDAYEAFAGSELRALEGQFFTPQNAVQWLVAAIDPKPGERIIDPACGAGGFIALATKHLISHGASLEQAAASVSGIEKDRYLASLAHAHVSLITLQKTAVTCADSLAMVDIDGNDIADDYIGKFDVVLANPPFGAKIVSASDTVRKRYALAHKWKRIKNGDRLAITSELSSSSSPQVLFIEQILNLLKPGGRAGLVVPESLISSKSYGHVVQYVRDRAEIQAVVGMPEALFKSSGKGGTHTKTCLVVLRKVPLSQKSRDRTYFAEAKWCGHDSRGNHIDNDDLPSTLKEFVQGPSSTEIPSISVPLGYWVESEDLVSNVLAPRYYDPASANLLKSHTDTHRLITVGELVQNRVLEITTGDEVGKLAYGTGTIPFVRTSDISNWEIKVDPKHGVSEEIYKALRVKQDVRAGDVLLVRDGTYLIGTPAIVTKYDERIVYQSHILKIRSLDHSVVSPFLLLALLSSEPVQAQIKAKRFTQDIIDSIGNRLLEVVLPIPIDSSHVEVIIENTERAVRDRVEARELSRRVRLGVMDVSLLAKLEEEPVVIGDMIDQLASAVQ